MAYEIISQNNNTTTLSDGTNTITVPARVTLATSTSYTITEVNNTTATLEGSDGSVIRDVPCVVVLAGGGSSDTHNKGFFATQAALEEAYPTGEAGDYAIVGATDTVWIWDEDSSAWVDTDTKGQVESVNGKTGTVVLNASDVDAIQQYTTMPTAVATDAGRIVQYVGTTSGSYTNGYFYIGKVSSTPSTASISQTVGNSLSDLLVDKSAFGGAVSGESGTYAFVYDGEYWNLDSTHVRLTDYGISFTGTPVTDDEITVVFNAAVFLYYWDRTDVQPAGLPSQTGNAGKFLTTDGTDASWGNNLPGTTTSWDTSGWGYRLERGNAQLKINCMLGASNSRSYYVFETGKFWGYYDFILRPSLGDANHKWGTVFATHLHNGDNISIPNVAGTLAIQVTTMPTAAVGELGNVYQFVGTTDANYTNGYFYKCVSDGQDPATYSWTAVQVQASSGGLPSQTGQSGKFLTTDGTDASWSDKPLVNKSNQSNSIAVSNSTDSSVANTQKAVMIGALAYGSGNESVMIGYNARSSGAYSVAIGGSAQASSSTSIAIGSGANVYNVAPRGISIGNGYSYATGAIQISTSNSYVGNQDANTVKIANANGNFEIMSADGTIPTDRFTTTPAADGTYVPTLTISSGVATRTWAAPSGGGSTALSLTLAAANWSNNSITVTATGVTASNNVIVAPAPASQADYTSAGIICTAQGAGTLTFTCTSTPSSDLTVNVLII